MYWIRLVNNFTGRGAKNEPWVTSRKQINITGRTFHAENSIHKGTELITIMLNKDRFFLTLVILTFWFRYSLLLGDVVFILGYFYWSIVMYSVTLISSECSELIFYILCNTFLGKCSYHLSPYNVSTIPLTLFPMLCLSSLWLIFFITEGLYFPLPFTHFAHSPL